MISRSIARFTEAEQRTLGYYTAIYRIGIEGVALQYTALELRFTPNLGPAIITRVTLEKNSSVTENTSLFFIPPSAVDLLNTGGGARGGVPVPKHTSKNPNFTMPFTAFNQTSAAFAPAPFIPVPPAGWIYITDWAYGTLASSSEGTIDFNNSPLAFSDGAGIGLIHTAPGISLRATFEMDLLANPNNRTVL